MAKTASSIFSGLNLANQKKLLESDAYKKKFGSDVTAWGLLWSSPTEMNSNVVAQKTAGLPTPTPVNTITPPKTVQAPTPTIPKPTSTIQAWGVKPFDLGEYNKFGRAADVLGSEWQWTRNQQIISNLWVKATNETSVRQFLWWQSGFIWATPDEQENTVQKILQEAAAGTWVQAWTQAGTQPPTTPAEAPTEASGWEMSEQDQLSQRYQEDINKLTDQFVQNETQMHNDLWKRKSQATNWEQIMGENGDMKKFNQAVLDAKATGEQFTIDDIARNLGRDKQKAEDFRVWLTRDSNLLTKYLDVPWVEEEVTSEYKKIFDKYDLEKNRKVDDLDREMERMEEDFTNKQERTQKEVDIEVYNNKFMSALTWLSFSTAWSEGIGYVQELARNTMNDIATQKERTLTDITRTKLRLLEDYDNLTNDAKKSMYDSINTAKTNFLTKVQWVQDKYWEYSAETLSKIEDVTRQFSKEYRTIQKETQKSVMDWFSLMQDMQNDLNDQNRFQQEYEQDFLNNMWQGSINMSTTSSEFQSLSPQSKMSAINNMVAMVAGALNQDGMWKKVDITAIQEWIANWQTSAQVYQELSGQMWLWSLPWIAAGGKYVQPEAWAQTQSYWGWGTQSYQSQVQQGIAKPYTPISEGDLASAVQDLNANEKYKDKTFLWDRWECWAFVNDWLEDVGIQMPWDENLITNTRAEKKAIINSTEPKVGSIAIVNSATHPENGHVAIITAINGDMLHVKEANWNKDHKIHERDIPISSMEWYFDPTKQASQAQGAEASKQTLSDIKLIESWMVNRSDIQWIQDQAYKEWLWDEFDKAMNKWANIYMTETQRNQMNKTRDKFKSNAVVKWFEEGMTQFENLSYSLSQESWPWDMGAIFQFMKTLDPTSVVRESEFEAAANSAGVASKRKNMFDKVSKWDLMTKEMTAEFKKLATAYIKNKWVSYERHYNDMARDLEWFNIDKQFYPTNAVEQLNKSIWSTTKKTTSTGWTVRKLR